MLGAYNTMITNDIRLVAVLAVVASILFLDLHAGAEVFLPGTQPGEANIRIAKVKLCKTCHSRTGNGESDPYQSWRGGMMSQAARDPVYLAALAIANQDVEGVGEFCIRCHAPAAWLEGRSKKPDASGLTDEDLGGGVSCDACHRLVDPAASEAKGMVKDLPPGPGSAMMVVDPGKVARGPYEESRKVNTHKAIHSPFHASSSLCGTCHDVSNPLAATDTKTQPPHTYGIIERTYSEWLLSDYAKEEGGRTCQSCHYPVVEGGGKAARQSSAPHRDHFVQHGPVGGSTWVQDAIADIWQVGDEERKALAWGKAKAIKLLRTSAKMEITFPEKNRAALRVKNLTGHKLPTGYTEGRRAWVNVKFLDANGKILKQLGEYGEREAKLAGKTLEVLDLLNPGSTRVYECLPGLTENQAKKYGKKAGKSFHFVLNDVIMKDSRIPPKGFNNEAFRKRGCEPVGVNYADGQYWDDFELEIPKGCKRIDASLLYESVTWDYVRFLFEENRTNEWGQKLFDAWKKHGQSPPAVMAAVSVDVP